MNGKKKNKIVRRIGRVFLVLLLLFIGLVLFVRSPWGQDVIVTKITDYVSGKTNTKVAIDRLFLTFSGNLFLEGLYLEDKKGDTLVYSKALEANIGLSPLIFGNSFNLKSLEWEGLNANILREEGNEKFNFDFLVDAFAATDTVSAQPESEPMQINIGSVALNDFKIDYTDGYLGIDSRVHLGGFYVETNEIDLEKMRFTLDELMLSDTEIAYEQTKPFPASQDTTATALPFLAVDDLEVKSVKVNYEVVPDSMLADLAIGHFQLEIPKADLAKNDIEIERLALKGSDILVRSAKQPEMVEDTVTVARSEFEWPNLIVRAAEVDSQNNTLKYSAGSSKPEKGKFNPDAISIFDFTLLANSIFYRPKELNLELDKLAFKEKSGFRLNNLAFDANLGATAAEISQLELATGNSFLNGEIQLDYDAVDELIDSPENSHIAVNIPKLELALQDAIYFRPDLAQNEYLKKASSKPFKGAFKANGTLAAIEIPDFGIKWGENTSLTAQGHLNQVTRTDSLYFDFKTVAARANRTDILEFISEKDLGVSVPNTVLLEATAKGSLDEIIGDAVLKIPEGTARLAGKFANKDAVAFDGILNVDSLRLDKLLKNESLGGISFKIDVSGSGNSIGSLNASLKSDFEQLEWKGYDFSNLFLEGEIVNGKGDIDLDFKDENLNVKAKTKVDLDSLNSKIRVDLNLIGADLYALGATREDIKAALNLSADFTGSPEDFSLKAKLFEGIAIYENEQYQMGDVDLSTRIGETETNVAIKSNFMNGLLLSNAAPDKLIAALQNQFRAYFNSTQGSDTITDPVKLEVDMALTPVPILTKVFLRGVERLDSVNLKADFDAVTKELSAKLYMPSLTYNGSAIDSLNVSVDGNATDLAFSAGLSELLSEPIHIKKTYFEGNLKNKELLLDFISYDNNEKLVHIASEMALEKDTIKLHINPTELVFNKKEWSIPQNNSIAIGEKRLAFENVVLSREAQELTVSNSLSEIEKEHIGVTFENFKLQTFLSLLNPDEALASGLVEGKFVVENPFEATGIVADFTINTLEVMQNPLGNLSLDAASKGQGNYDFNLALKDGGVDLDLKGDYAAAENGAKLNLDLNLNKLELKVLEGLSGGGIKDAHGYISGSVSVAGTTTEPKYEGELKFNGADFNVATLNSVFKIEDETLKIDNSGLYLDSFQIVDSNNSMFTIDGNILTEDITNPSFNLTLDAEAFRILDSTEKDNDLYYGVASLDADLSVKGDLKLPKIDGKLRVRKITDVTYVVPEEQLDVEERDGVVIFVNRENPDAILTRNDQEKTPSLLKGFDLSTVLEIADDAVFHIIIDEKTGDNLEVSGDAELNLDMAPNGRINLTGRYELKSGHYETSLYNLVNRKFLIKPGGTITWQGDPTDAALDVTAIYEVETSAAPLMAAVTSGQDVNVTGKYQQVLPFLVYLNVEGELLEPELSFDLDMPEDEQGSLGGAVYGRVQQLNEQEAALNKQVFSLLALNRFFPDSGSDGSGGGTAALARDNVNKVLSGQLNAFSDKIFGNAGFELDFDLDSFTDYQGQNPQDRTRLNINAKKKLFDDRLVVTAGSAVDVEGSAQTDQGQSPIIGNVSLEYLLTEDGRYRLKGFRKNEYENVIDGQLIVTGLALIFNREFNAFSQLFNPLKDDVEEEENDDEENEKSDKRDKREN